MTRQRTALIGIAVSLFLAACHFDGVTAADGSFGRGTASHSLTVGALSRRFLLHVPAKRPVTTAGVVRGYSLIIVLHGSAGSADDMRQTTGLDSISEEGRFLVAYGQGVQGGGGLFPSDWNAGKCCGAAARENIDDVGYVKGIIATVGASLAVDTTRIYVAGFSDGGRMAHHLGCQMSATIAAIAVVSGSLEDDGCRPTKPVALIAIHGTADPEVAYDAPSLTPPSVAVTGSDSLPPAVVFWAARNGCKGVAKSQTAADVVRSVFSGCTGAEVTLYTIAGGVHAWPSDPGGAGSQPPMSELKASRVITAFFARQVRR